VSPLKQQIFAGEIGKDFSHCERTFAVTGKEQVEKLRGWEDAKKQGFKKID
jgi:hypothetical protein